jgi:hypothetical protein
VDVGRCAPPPGEGADGDLCTADGDCAGLFCVLEEWGWPGGYCSGYCDASSPCAGGGICASDDTCNSACETDTDCREGYMCTPEGCLPAPPAPAESADGDACTADSECISGMCYGGWPGGSCTGDCETDADCAEGGICAAVDNTCNHACDTDADCRDGYGCTEANGCVPQ